jgi:hypothetical protein
MKSVVLMLIKHLKEHPQIFNMRKPLEQPKGIDLILTQMGFIRLATDPLLYLLRVLEFVSQTLIVLLG